MFFFLPYASRIYYIPSEHIIKLIKCFRKEAGGKIEADSKNDVAQRHGKMETRPRTSSDMSQR